MSKVVFVLQRKDGTTREECLDSWAGDDHIALLRKLPGLTKSDPGSREVGSGRPETGDGIGELWFESDVAMEKALNSPEMVAAVADAKNFLLDMEKTGLVIVEEKTVLG